MKRSSDVVKEMCNVSSKKTHTGSESKLHHDNSNRYSLLIHLYNNKYQTNHWTLNNIFLTDIFSQIIQSFLTDNDSLYVLQSHSSFYHFYRANPRLLSHSIDKEVLLRIATHYFVGLQTCFYINNIDYYFTDNNQLTNVEWSRIQSYGIYVSNNSLRFNVRYFCPYGWILPIPLGVPSVYDLTISGGAESKRKNPYLASLDVINSIFSYLDNLTSLNMEHVSMLPSLMNNIFLSPTNTLSVIPTKNFPLLTKLSVMIRKTCDFKFWSMMMPLFPSINDLSIRYHSNESHNLNIRRAHLGNFVNFLSKLTSRITHLSFSGFTIFNSRILTMIGTYASKNCQKLSFLECIFNSDFSQTLFAIPYENLLSLSMTTCTFDQSFSLDISRICPMLNYLDLENCDISNEEMRELMKRIPNKSALKIINFNGNNIECDSFKYLLYTIDKFPCLERLLVRRNEIGVKGLEYYLTLLNFQYTSTFLASVYDIDEIISHKRSSIELKQLLSIHLGGINDDEMFFEYSDVAKLLNLITSLRIMIQMFVKMRSIEDIDIDIEDDENYFFNSHKNLQEMEES